MFCELSFDVFVLCNVRKLQLEKDGVDDLLRRVLGWGAAAGPRGEGPCGTLLVDDQIFFMLAAMHSLHAVCR